MKITVADKVTLLRDKYGGNADANLEHDEERLGAGEPLAYVIGWIPFLGINVRLDSRPLIPRPETEWWTEQLVLHLKDRFQDQPFSVLDLCAGSGAIGMAIMKAFPHAHITFVEIDPNHAGQIQRNLAINALNLAQATIYESDLFKQLPNDVRFDVIATNPPYVPEHRQLERSVMEYEPHLALFAGGDGTSVMKEIWKRATEHLNAGGEVWMECDQSNIDKAQKFAEAAGFKAEIRNDQYEQRRFVVASLSTS